MDASSVAADPAGHSGSPFWIATDSGVSCPICASASAQTRLADDVLRHARAVFTATVHRPLAYFRCGGCGTVYAPEGESLRYEDAHGGQDALRHYLEEGAGIDLLIEPLCRLDRTGTQRYAEIGCAFGFSLDFARLMLGWDVRGIDPSPLAGAGRDALGLPIDRRYFTEHCALPAPKADVLQVAEVIEHIVDTHALMRALVASLDENGILIISTPNAAVLQAETADDLLLQVLQPGVHLRLFTAQSLAILAETHGLAHYHVHATADDLTLYAAPRPFVLRSDPDDHRARYLKYLRRRLADTPGRGPLRRGLQSRLLRELTLQGRFAETDTRLPGIVSDYRACAIELTEPATLTPSAEAPHNVAALLYCLGMSQLLGRSDRRGALAYFDACVAWHDGVSARRAVAGVKDASAAVLARLATAQATNLRIEIDPQAAHDRWNSDSAGNPLSPLDRQLLFNALVNLGDHARAASHHVWALTAVEAADQGRDDPIDRSVGQRAMTCFTLGIFALNHRDDRPRARRWLARAADLADSESGNEAIRQEAVIALHRAADAPPSSDAGDAPSPDRQHSTGRTYIRRLLARFGGGGPRRPKISFARLSESPDQALLPPLDRTVLDETALTPEQREWRRDGLLILRKFLPDSITDPYIARRATLDSPGGWLSPAPYLQVAELRALALFPPLMRMLAHLISEPMLLHLALTGWISTERDWHQDDYLNPPFVNSWYCAVWIALDHIDPASGPFEYVPGSHRWPLLRGEKVRRFLTEEERTRQEFGVNHWPKYSERFVAPAIEAEIARQRIAPRTFLAEKGDVLIWHGRLMHRGSVAIERGRERRSLITHYSGVNHRPDMPAREADANGQMYAMFDIPLH